MKRKFLLSLLFLISTANIIKIAAQDSVAKYQWSASSKKIADKKYELIFSTTGSQGWQLYAPNQMPGGVKSVDLIIKDSSITLENQFAESGESKSFQSPVFEKETVKVYEGATEWKATITFKDQVPALLEGTLTYFYGNDSAFNSDIPLTFNVRLEGGIESKAE